ncbi:hypothetical protein KUH03_30725 [Sphingobacterium sp. E70]|uniref:hypothetical protein n=1 Tax=Sphingobacterium sp. E70 TaxID=2853439 RepID=UPI0027963748|nr:hypothetical protein [Sphingobacterium sp. E70]ULT23512.1 hypothetical protein KUH03_30725 [Sphingobacterium sp. E70]
MQRRVIAAESGIVGTNPYANIGKVKNSGFDGELSYQQQFSPTSILILEELSPIPKISYWTEMNHNFLTHTSLNLENR